MTPATGWLKYSPNKGVFSEASHATPAPWSNRYPNDGFCRETGHMSLAIGSSKPFPNTSRWSPCGQTTASFKATSKRTADEAKVHQPRQPFRTRSRTPSQNVNGKCPRHANDPRNGHAGPPVIFRASCVRPGLPFARRPQASRRSIPHVHAKGRGTPARPADFRGVSCSSEWHGTQI